MCAAASRVAEAIHVALPLAVGAACLAVPGPVGLAAALPKVKGLPFSCRAFWPNSPECTASKGSVTTARKFRSRKPWHRRNYFHRPQNEVCHGGPFSGPLIRRIRNDGFGSVRDGRISSFDACQLGSHSAGSLLPVLLSCVCCQGQEAAPCSALAARRRPRKT